MTAEISAEKFVSISKVILFVTAISTDLSISAKNKESLPEVKEMIEELKEGMDKRFKHIEDNDLYTQANLLDPRFKKYSFLSDAKYKKACDRLKQKAASTIIPTNDITSNAGPGISESEIEPNLTNDDGPTMRKRRLYSRFDQTVEKNSESTSKLAAGIIEVNKYFEEELANRKEDPLVWWKARKHVYPRLFSLVKKRLCIQATSVPCERLFSKAGQIQNEKRSRMKSSKVSQILFLNHNT